MEPDFRAVRGNAGCVHATFPARLLPYLAILLVFAFSLAVRWDALGQGWSAAPYQTARKWNGEAEADFLRYVRSYGLSPMAPGWLLPSYPPDSVEGVLGHGRQARPAKGAHVSRAKTSVEVDRRGRLVYLSFPPGSFLAAYGLFALSGLDASPGALQVANLFLHLLCGCLIYETSLAAFYGTWERSPAARGLCVAAASVYLLAPGPMHDHVATFWPHHLLQPLMLASLLAMARQEPGRLTAPVLGTLAYAGTMTEWSANLFNLGSAILAGWMGRKTASCRPWKTVSACIVAGEVLGLVSLLAVDSTAAGPGAYLHVLSGRAMSRASSMTGASAARYLSGLAWYCGPYLLLVPAAGAIALWARCRTPGCGTPFPGAALAVPLALACCENLVLAAHATDYGFDELKVTALLSLLLGWAFSQLVRWRPALLRLLLGAALLAGVASCWLYLPLYADRWDGASGRMSSATACMRVGRDVAAAIDRSLEPGEILLSTPEQDSGLFTGRFPAFATTTGQALGLLEQSGRHTARYYILGGTGFDGLQEPLHDASPTAEIVLVQGDGRAGIVLHPLSQTWTAEGAGSVSRLALANRQVAALVPVGTVLTGPGGRTATVQTSDAATGQLVLLYPGAPPDPAAAPALHGSILLDEAAMRLDLSPPEATADWDGCNMDEKPQPMTAFPWNRPRG